VSALWRVGLKARGLAVGLVGLVCTYCALAASIGAGIHKDYGTPTPVRHFNLFRTLWSSLTSPTLVLVFCQPPLSSGTPSRYMGLHVAGTIFFGIILHPIIPLEGGSPVGR
jgi:hypothetical protein